MQFLTPHSREWRLTSSPKLQLAAKRKRTSRAAAGF
jgi:hypothetical protein